MTTLKELMERAMPGKWRVAREGNWSVSIDCIREDGISEIAKVRMFKTPDDPAGWANAELIVRAKESIGPLVEAANKLLIALYSNMTGMENCREAGELRAALKLAECGHD